METVSPHMAAIRNAAGVIRARPAKGAAIDGRDDRGRTALPAATHAGADVNPADGRDVTPPQHARSRGCAPIAKMPAVAGAR